ncbi:RHS repeat-associated core domain-containing protein, partial [Nonomuraea sp. NPDC002799]
DGDRLIRKTPTDSTLYIDDMELRFDFAKDAVEQTRYYTIGGEPIAVRTPDNQVSFLVNDHQGTAQAAVNASTGELAVRRQTPFGEDRGAPPSWWPGQRGFVGGTKDSTTGLVHLGAREYDPKNGRFISVDPVMEEQNPQQLNAYAYANNSPVTMSDPDGQLFWFAAIFAARIAAQIIARRLAIAAARRAAIAAARAAARRAALAAARRRALAEARRRAAAAAKKKALEAAKKKAAAAARKRLQEQAKKKAAERARKAATARAQRRAAAAARREAKRKAADAAARRRASAAARTRNRRAGRLPSGVQRARQRPTSRPTSHRATQRQSPPRDSRQPMQPRPSQIYRNDGSTQPTQSYTVYRDGRMYPDGPPPAARSGGSGQGERQIFRPERVEPENTRTGTVAETGFRVTGWIDKSGLGDALDIIIWGLGG